MLLITTREMKVAPLSVCGLFCKVLSLNLFVWCPQMVLLMLPCQHGTHQLKIQAQALLSATQLTPRLIHPSNLDQNKPLDCSVEWDFLWKMGLLEARHY